MGVDRILNFPEENKMSYLSDQTKKVIGLMKASGFLRRQFSVSTALDRSTGLYKTIVICFAPKGNQIAGAREMARRGLQVTLSRIDGKLTYPSIRFDSGEGRGIYTVIDLDAHKMEEQTVY